MNNTDKLKELLNSIGILTEMWIITFNQFKSMGLMLEMLLITRESALHL